MKDLEQTVENGFNKFRNSLNRIKPSVVGKFAIYSLVGIFGGGAGYGCESENNDVYKSACHELVATCNHDSECTVWAKAMIDQKDYSHCSGLKSQCQCH